MLDVFLSKRTEQEITVVEHASPTASRPATSHAQKKPPVIEISSPNSGGGKSQLIYYLAAICVLPATFKGRKTGGRDGAVVLLDTDGKLDIRRLYQIAEGVVWHSLRANTRQNATAEGAMMSENERDIQVGEFVMIIIGVR